MNTPLPGVVWCNCPHMTGYDGMKVEDQTRADFEGRKRIYALVEFIHANMPGFENCYVIDVAPQLGVRNGLARTSRCPPAPGTRCPR